MAVTEGSGNGVKREADFCSLEVYRVINVFRLGILGEKSMWLLSRKSSSPPVCGPVRFPESCQFLDMRGIWSEFRCFVQGSSNLGQSCENSGLPVAAKCFHPRPTDRRSTAAVSSRSGGDADNRNAAMFSHLMNVMRRIAPGIAAP